MIERPAVFDAGDVEVSDAGACAGLSPSSRDSHEAVSVRLPETTDCDASGAICTSDGRPLSHSLSATVAGPVGIAVADARVEEGDGVGAAVRGDAQPRGERRADGGLCDGGRQRACGRRLHGGERDAELRGRRAVEDDRGRGARRRARRGRGDADAAAFRHLVGPADRRRGHRDDREPRSDAAGAAGAVRAGGGGARGRARGGAAGGAARAGLPGPVRWPGAAARYGARRRAQLPPAAERRGRRRFDGRRSDGRGRRPAVRRAGGRDGGSGDAGACRRWRAPGRGRRGSDGRSHADGRRARCDGHVRRADGRRVPPGRRVQRRRTPADGTGRR